MQSTSRADRRGGTSGIGLGDEGKHPLEHVRVARVEPVHPQVAAEPRHLPPPEAAGPGRDVGPGPRVVRTAGQEVEHLCVADRTRRRRAHARREAAGLLDQAVRPHPVHAGLDPRVEHVPRAVEADLDKVRKGVGDCNLEINDARYGTTPDKVAQAGQQIAAGGTEIPQGDTNQKLAFIADMIFKAIMILMIVSCLLTAFIFLALRIVVMWALLASID